MEASLAPVMEELKLIRKELHEIKETMPDRDMFLTAEEKALLEQSYKNEKEGKLVSGAILRKQLGL